MVIDQLKTIHHSVVAAAAAAAAVVVAVAVAVAQDTIEYESQDDAALARCYD